MSFFGCKRHKYAKAKIIVEFDRHPENNRYGWARVCIKCNEVKEEFIAWAPYENKVLEPSIIELKSGPPMLPI